MRADETIAVELINRIKKGESANINRILYCIAFINCQQTIEFLRNSSIEPLPKWATSLNLLPIEYSKVAGWSLDNHNRYKKLYREDIIAFEQTEDLKSEPIFPYRKLSNLCQYCNHHLILIFNHDIPLATCINCSTYQTIFLKIDGNDIHWHTLNHMTSFFKENINLFTQYTCDDIEKNLKISDEIRKSTYTASQFADISRTQIGGFPTSINDIDYPKCPECSETMIFIAQLSSEDIWEYGEGIYYFFECEKCCVTACNYDQS